MPVTPPLCSICLTHHWLRDGHHIADPERVARPRECSVCSTVHERSERCPPVSATVALTVAPMNPLNAAPRPRPRSPRKIFEEKGVQLPMPQPKPVTRDVIERALQQPIRNDLVRVEESSARPSERNVEMPPVRKTFDKKTWMREYMREYRRGDRRTKPSK